MACAFDEDADETGQCRFVQEYFFVRGEKVHQRATIAVTRSTEMFQASYKGDNSNSDEHSRGTEHAAPTQQVGKRAREDRADDITCRCACNNAADRDLAFAWLGEVACKAEACRRDAARCRAGNNPTDHQGLERRSECAGEGRESQYCEAPQYDLGLTIAVSHNSHRGLDEGIGKAEGRSQSGSRLQGSPKFCGNLRKSRIDSRHHADGKDGYSQN